MCTLFQAREEVFHAQLVAMSTQSGPGSQSSDLLDDSELMTDDRELDADLVGKRMTCINKERNVYKTYNIRC